MSFLNLELNLPSQLDGFLLGFIFLKLNGGTSLWLKWPGVYNIVWSLVSAAGFPFSTTVKFWKDDTHFTCYCRYCDAVGCKRGYHLSCLDPPVNNVPSGNWHCPFCVNNIKSRVQVAESIWDTREVVVSDAEGLKELMTVFLKKLKSLKHLQVVLTSMFLALSVLAFWKSTQHAIFFFRFVDAEAVFC